MKKLILFTFIVLISSLSFGQQTKPSVTPSAVFRVANETVHFRRNLPIGTIIYVGSTYKTYVCKAAIDSSTYINLGVSNNTIMQIDASGSVAVKDSNNMSASTVKGYVTPYYLSQQYVTRSNTRASYVDEWDEPTTGSTGTAHTLTKVGVVLNSTVITLNGMALKKAEYSISTTGTTILTILFPVYQYDRVVCMYDYLIGSGGIETTVQ